VFGYPVSLELGGHRVAVIGADAVAHGKVDALLVAGAEVTVVATGPSAELARLERDPRVTLHRRAWQPEDLDGATLCVAASDDPEERAAIYAAGRERGVLMNVMDDIPHCDFAAPAVVRRGDLAVAVSTGGRSPALARRLRIELEHRFGPEWTTVMEVLGEVRAETLDALPDLTDRARRWQSALDLDECERLARAGRAAELKRRLVTRLTGPQAPAERAS
jgi:siroheme synthase-like protein